MRKEMVPRVSGMIFALQKFYYKAYREDILSRALILCCERIGLCWGKENCVQEETSN